MSTTHHNVKGWHAERLQTIRLARLCTVLNPGQYGQIQFPDSVFATYQIRWSVVILRPPQNFKTKPKHHGPRNRKNTSSGNKKHRRSHGWTFRRRTTSLKWNKFGLSRNDNIRHFSGSTFYHEWRTKTPVEMPPGFSGNNSWALSTTQRKVRMWKR